MGIAELDRLKIVLDPVGQGGIIAALILVMFGVALGLRLENFRSLASRPRLFFGGVLTQVLLLPAVTVLLITLIAPPPSIALGMIVVACCPGGAVSNLLTHLSRGDVAVSVALTATSSLLAALLTPVSILFWSRVYAPTSELLEALVVSPWLFVLQTTVLLAIPLVAGMTVAANAPALARGIKRHTTWAGSLTLAGTVVYGVFYFFPVLWPAAGMLIGIAAIHNAVAFGIGAFAAHVLTDVQPERRALTFEIGIQNAGLALIILLAQLDGIGGAAAIAAVWGVWHLFAGGLLALFYNFGRATQVVLTGPREP